MHASSPVLLSQLVFVLVALFMLSGAAGWLAGKLPRAGRAWAKDQPRWGLWLLFFLGLFLVGFSLPLVAGWVPPGQ